MFAYSSDSGHDGGDVTLLKTADIRNVGSLFDFFSLEWG